MPCAGLKKRARRRPPPLLLSLTCRFSRRRSDSLAPAACSRAESSSLTNRSELEASIWVRRLCACGGERKRDERAGRRRRAWGLATLGHSRPPLSLAPTHRRKFSMDGSPREARTSSGVSVNVAPAGGSCRERSKSRRLAVASAAILFFFWAPRRREGEGKGRVCAECVAVSCGRGLCRGGTAAGELGAQKLTGAAGAGVVRAKKTCVS